MADIPEGWQLVPTELTEDMAAAIELASGTEQLWLDVLSAAPAPPSPVPSSERDEMQIAKLCDSQYIAGMKAGWNYCVAGDEAGYQRTVENYIRERAALKSQPAQEAE